MTRKLKKGIKKLITLLLLVPSILLFTFMFFEPAFVDGESMSPTLDNYSLVLIKKSPFSKMKYSKNQIVMFRRSQRTEVYIKRVVALPQEAISIEQNKVWVNKIKLDENNTNPGSWLKENESELLENCYFMLGDNRDHSIDSRDFGCIENELITGLAIAVIWPPSEIKILK